MNAGEIKHIEDNELLERFASDRNNKWLGLLLERYTILLLGVCMKYLKNEEEAKDAVQQVFLKAITELGKYKVNYFKSWIYMVAKNHCLMKLRDRQNRHTDSFPEELIPAAELPEPGTLRQMENTYNYLEESLQELNEAQQQCVTLFYLQKNSYQEISERTGFSMMQVKSYIQNGKRNLRLLIEKKQSENKTGNP